MKLRSILDGYRDIKNMPKDAGWTTNTIQNYLPFSIKPVPRQSGRCPLERCSSEYEIRDEIRISLIKKGHIKKIRSLINQKQNTPLSKKHVD